MGDGRSAGASEAQETLRGPAHPHGPASLRGRRWRRMRGLRVSAECGPGTRSRPCPRSPGTPRPSRRSRLETSPMHPSIRRHLPMLRPPPQRSEKRAGEAVPVARSEGEETVSDARWGGWRREQVRTPERQRPARRAHLRGDRDGRVAASGSARRPRGAIGWLVNAARQHAIFSGIAAVNHLVREFA